MGHLNGLLQRNRAYAAAHGYAYHHIGKIDLDLPVFWIKPFLLAHFLHTTYDTILWLDTDAVVHDIDRRIEDFFVGDEGLVYSQDLPVWPAPFNAGVFACRKHALPLFQEWCGLFPQDQWMKDEHGKWQCLHEEWAGPAYEQGAFSQIILPKYKDGPLLREVSWKVLQNPFPTPESFTLHFMATFKVNVPIYLAGMQPDT